MKEYVPGSGKNGNYTATRSFIPITTVIDPTIGTIFSDVYVTITSGWTGTTTGVRNDGVNFPTLIRIYGKMN